MSPDFIARLQRISDRFSYAVIALTVAAFGAQLIRWWMA